MRPVVGLLALVATACDAHPKLHFNEPPGAPEVSLTPSEPTTDDPIQGVVADAVDPEGDPLDYRYVWTRDGASWVVPALVVDPAQTAKGQVWRLEVYASDGEYEGEAGVAEVTVVNSAPVMASLSLSPAAPRTSDDLVVTASASDADDDSTSYLLTWSVDGEERPEYDNLTTLPAEATESGERWQVSVAPFDGDLQGEPMLAEVSIDNSPPSVDRLVIYPDDPLTGDSLAATAYEVDDPDGDAVILSFDWYADGVLMATESGTATTSYYTGPIARGQLWQAVVTPSDDTISGSSVASDFVEVGNTAPELSGATLSPSPGYEGSTLSCEAEGEADADGDDVALDYDWLVNGSSVGASGSTLTGSNFSRGDTVQCGLTPTDGDADGSTTWSNEVDIENTLPSLSGVSISPSTLTKSTSATASVSGWDDDDGDGQNVRYSWYVDGSAVATGSSLSTGWFSRGDAVYVTAVPYDSYGDGATVTSASVTVSNAAPSLSSAWISPSTLTASTDATVQTSGFSDADGDSASYAYAWYVNGAAVSSTSSTLGAGNFVRGDRVYATVTPSDGIDTGSTVTTSTITVSNTTPSAVASVDDDSGLEQCDSIILDAANSTDADSDALSYTWTLVSKPSSSRRSSSDIADTDDPSPTFVVDAEGTFSFNVRVSDGSSYDDATVDVDVVDRTSNSDPVASAGDDQSSAETSACVTNGYTVVCPDCDDATFALSAAASTDADGDALTYAWTYTASPAVSIDSTTSATPTVTISGVVPTYGETTTVDPTFTVTVYDCAGGRSTDTVTLTYTCTGS